jgi:hypothetical protein
MFLLLDKYLDELLSGIASCDGKLLASLLSFRDSHASPIAKAFEKVQWKTYSQTGPNTMLISSKIPAPWSDIVIYHLQVAMAAKDPILVVELQNTLAQ